MNIGSDESSLWGLGTFEDTFEKWRRVKHVGRHTEGVGAHLKTGSGEKSKLSAYSGGGGQ